MMILSRGGCWLDIARSVRIRGLSLNSKLLPILRHTQTTAVCPPQLPISLIRMINIKYWNRSLCGHEQVLAMLPSSIEFNPYGRDKEEVLAQDLSGRLWGYMQAALTVDTWTAPDGLVFRSAVFHYSPSSSTDLFLLADETCTRCTTIERTRRDRRIRKRGWPKYT